jgi:hypothetical protein
MNPPEEKERLLGVSSSLEKGDWLLFRKVACPLFMAPNYFFMGSRGWGQVSCNLFERPEYRDGGWRDPLKPDRILQSF